MSAQIAEQLGLDYFIPSVGPKKTGYENRAAHTASVEIFREQYHQPHFGKKNDTPAVDAEDARLAAHHVSDKKSTPTSTRRLNPADDLALMGLTQQYQSVKGVSDAKGNQLHNETNAKRDPQPLQIPQRYWVV